MKDYFNNSEENSNDTSDALLEQFSQPGNSSSSPIPVISLDPATKDRIRNPWRKCLIGKVLGKSIGFKFLQERINVMWRPVGQIQILDLRKDFFLFKFANVEDLKNALLHGPWFISGHYFSLIDGNRILSRRKLKF